MEEVSNHYGDGEEYTTFSYKAENQQELFSQIYDWQENYLLLTGWYNLKYVSMVFVKENNLHKVILTCKIDVNEEAFAEDEEESESKNKKGKDNKDNLPPSIVAEDLPF